MNILVLNAGSSTLKCAIFESSDQPDPLWKGGLDWGKGKEEIVMSHMKRKGRLQRSTIQMDNIEDAIKSLLKTAWDGTEKALDGPVEIQSIGHRVVHGGEIFVEPTLITEDVKKQIHDLSQLAPLHNPYNLNGIEVTSSLFPEIPQYAVFDTGYHATLNETVTTYPIPAEWRKMGIRKYGFHGISHQYCAEKAAEILQKDQKNLKVITCHLGNGSSLAATKGGKCIDTTMGYTPLDGLMMGTRPGSLDPGILARVLREKTLTSEQLDKLLNNECGMKAVCGISDMRVILEEMDQDKEKAGLAFRMFVHRLKSYIGAMASSLDGVDVLVFTAGIGENSPLVRDAVCQGLSYLGVSIDPSINENCTPDQLISLPGSSVSVLVVHTREEYAIARSWSVLK
jgi:acetate kinase